MLWQKGKLHVRLFHFSENPHITAFTPRPPQIKPERPSKQKWLNDPLVWAIDDQHQPLYYFPRQCPRILIWPVSVTNQADRCWFREQTTGRMIAYIEKDWRQIHSTGNIWRYALPSKTFRSLSDAGMYVSHSPVTAMQRLLFANLPGALEAANIELRIIPRLDALKWLWKTTLHVSAIRLRNSSSWNQG